MLIPKREGTFTIGPIEIRTKSETVRARPVTLTVTKAGATPPPAAANKPGESGSSEGSPELFVRATVDKTHPYVNEQVTYRVRLYLGANLLEGPSFTPPTTQGFWKEDLPHHDPYSERVNGRLYRVLEVDLAVFPTAPGKLTVGSSTFDCNVEAPVTNNDPFALFGRGFMDGRRVQLKSDPVDLEVKPLPPGAPAGFSGMVGDYHVEARVDRNRVAQNEPVNLTVVVQGTGNLNSVGDVTLPPLPEFRSYPSEKSSSTNQQGMVLGGKVSRQFVLVPMSAGEKEIPSITMVAFSPRTGTYQTLSTEPIPITVTAGAAGAAGGAGSRRAPGATSRWWATTSGSSRPRCRPSAPGADRGGAPACGSSCSRRPPWPTAGPGWWSAGAGSWARTWRFAGGSPRRGTPGRC